MKIIVAGGTGFIGRPLCDALAGAGHDLVVLSRSPRASASARIRYAPWQPPAEGEWALEVQDADAIINLAGEPLVARRWTPAQKARIISSRLEATRALVDAIRSSPSRRPRVLINASAVGYYGPQENERALDETAPHGQDFLAQACRQWEQAAGAAESLGVRVVRIRIGLVLAKDGGALKIMLPPFRMGLGGSLGSGRQWLSWIHRRDLIRLIGWALEEERCAGAVNGTAPNPVSMSEFARTLGRTLKRPAVMPVPGWVLRAILGEMSQVLLTGQRVIPKAALTFGFQFDYPLLPDALADCVKKCQTLFARGKVSDTF